MRSLSTFGNAASLAILSLRAHKLRTFLTLLGVIIGVGSVVIVGAAIEGLGSYAEQTTSKVFGSDGFQVGQLLQSTRLSRRERLEKLKYNKQIRDEDFRYLRAVNGDRILYSPYRSRSEDISVGSERAEDCQIIGAAASLSEIRDLNLTDGRFFTEQEEQNRVPVAVIGDEVRSKLFPDASPIGKTIRISGLDFTVVGVQEKIGSAGGASQDLSAFIPVTAFTRLYGLQRTMVLFARARPGTGLTLEELLTQPAWRSAPVSRHNPARKITSTPSPQIPSASSSGASWRSSARSWFRLPPFPSSSAASSS